jgi:hypothetical protein
LLDGVASVIPGNVYVSQELAAEIADKVIGAHNVVAADATDQGLTSPAPQFAR